VKELTIWFSRMVQKRRSSMSVEAIFVRGPQLQPTRGSVGSVGDWWCSWYGDSAAVVLAVVVVLLVLVLLLTCIVVERVCRRRRRICSCPLVQTTMTSRSR
jgi:hypothetical protein